MNLHRVQLERRNRGYRRRTSVEVRVLRSLLDGPAYEKALDMVNMALASKSLPPPMILRPDGTLSYINFERQNNRPQPIGIDLAGLSELQRQAVILYMGGDSYGEIAKALECTRGTVQVHLERTHDRLGDGLWRAVLQHRATLRT